LLLFLLLPPFDLPTLLLFGFTALSLQSLFFLKFAAARFDFL
jgi:hypothetical protein